jgi:hypothetical protein
MPPNNPITMPKIIAATITVGVILKLNTTSLNVTWFDVPVVMPLKGSIRTIPISAPNKDNISDSSTNDV